ncbi:MAG: type 1 periplasmic binding fold superfamily protein [Saprospiraceae bacterium]|nr:type 1 periplasmic binding fold superfamily protein [Saprospiraceae bacterium]
MNNIIQALAAPCFIACITLTACEKKDPVIPNPEELITTLTYTLVAGGGETAQFTFFDPDGDGGIAPVLTADTLTANTSYTGVMTLRNEAQTPPEDIGAEVAEEAEDHQFFFEVLQANATISYDDTDSNGQPIGLSSTLVTGEPSQGTLTIVLRHEPDKSAPGVANGQIANAGGETDIEVTFDLVIR